MVSSNNNFKYLSTMKYKLILLSLILGYSQVWAQNLLTPQWKFKTGDDDNLIAVRVYNGGGSRGMYTPDIALKIAGVEDFIVISPDFKESDRILLTHDPILMPVKLKNTSSGKIKGKMVVKVTSDFKENL